MASTTHRVLIIGAGVAAACTARLLAEKGLDSLVLALGEAPGDGASGNAQGALYVKPGMVWNTDNALAMEALAFASDSYSRWQSQIPEIRFWHPTGLLQVAWNDAERERLRRLSVSPHYGPETLRTVSAAEASALAGITLDQPALWYPQSGWVQPDRLCGALLDHPRIEFRGNSRVVALNRDLSGWALTLADGSTIASASVLICAGADSSALMPTDNPLPIKPIRGQVSVLPVTDHDSPRVVVCGDGYVNPPLDGQQLIGASFDIGDSEPLPKASSHEENRDRIRAWLPDFPHQWPPTEQWRGRVGFRATTPDYQPIAGTAWEDDALVNWVRRHPKLRGIAAEAPLQREGLFVLAGLGSKGLAYSPLLASHLADLITGQPSSLGPELADRVAPARFRARQIRRQS